MIATDPVMSVYVMQRISNFVLVRKKIICLLLSAGSLCKQLIVVKYCLTRRARYRYIRLCFGALLLFYRLS